MVKYLYGVLGLIWRIGEKNTENHPSVISHCVSSNADKIQNRKVAFFYIHILELNQSPLESPLVLDGQGFCLDSKFRDFSKWSCQASSSCLTKTV